MIGESVREHKWKIIKHRTDQRNVLTKTSLFCNRWKKTKKQKSVKNKELKKRNGAENGTFLAPSEEEHFLLFTFYLWTGLGQYLSYTSAGKYASSRRQNYSLRGSKSSRQDLRNFVRRFEEGKSSVLTGDVISFLHRIQKNASLCLL